MALKDLWDAERKKRREEMRLRSWEVGTTIDQFATDRQDMARQQRNRLDAFKMQLRQDRNELADRSAAEKNDRLYLGAERQEEIQNFLAVAADRRYQEAVQQAGKAQKQAEELAEFARNLTEQTALFLRATSTERSLMSSQLAADLQDFHEKLSNTVALERTGLQRQQLERKITLSRDLAAFMEELRSDTSQYLQELELSRESGTREIQGQLAQYVADLQMAVWGSARPQANSANVPARKNGSATTSFGNGTPIKATVQSAKVLGRGAAISAPTVKPQKTSAAPMPPAPVKPKPPSPPQPEIKARGVSYEEEIYEYISKSEGKRLKEIEEALGVNRVQSVDALRSLIQQGLIVERDRLYYLPAS
ncbi:MAG: hypothetical protein F6J93_03225 [Oscillatoria sp. SIO1A7]|nr:hypothetical protein [Oscillatoria sp. SIO1A7]